MEMTPVFVMSGIFTLASTLCGCVAAFRKTKKDIVFLHVCCDAFDLLTYLVLKGRTGMANAVAALCKDAAYSRMGSMLFTVIFAILRIILLVMGYEGILTLLFIFMEILSIFALKYGTVQQLRFLMVVDQGVWIVYDCLFATPVVAFFTSVVFISRVAAFVKNTHGKEGKHVT